MIDIAALADMDANVSITITAKDLREAFCSWAEAIGKENADNASDELLTKAEVKELLGVGERALWNWNNVGYLKSVKIGKKVYYRKSDIDNLAKTRL